MTLKCGLMCFIEHIPSTVQLQFIELNNSSSYNSSCSFINATLKPLFPSEFVSYLNIKISILSEEPLRVDGF